MPRIGISPTRQETTTYRPARVTAVIITYIPHLEGYFAQRLDILKIVLQSLRAHTRVPYDLLIFDNGSCAEVVDYLRSAQAEGEIDYLLLSRRNVGKIGAFQIAFPAAPGEVIAYADDDVLFYPGWLEASLRILDTFPKAGMVSAVPVRDAANRSHETLEALLASPPSGMEIYQARRIPDAWEADWAISTGRDPQAHLEATREHQDWVLRYHGIETIGSANHFQFLSPKEVILQALPTTWSGRLMGQMIALEARIDALGYLRLSTVERYVRHLGNALTPELVEEIRALGLAVEAQPVRLRKKKHWLLRIPGSGRVLWPLYRYLFRVLHGVE